MPIKKTKAVDAKFQKSMVGFYNAIKANNELIQKLLEVGLSNESISVLFPTLKKLDFDREFNEAAPGRNMQYSTFKSTGGGGLDLPFLTVEQLQMLFSAITGTPNAADVRQFNAFLARLDGRAALVQENVDQNIALVDALGLSYDRFSDYGEVFASVISGLVQVSGILNLYEPSDRTDTTIPPAIFTGDPINGQPITDIATLKKVIKTGDPTLIRDLVIQIINVICQNNDDVRQRFITNFTTATNRQGHKASNTAALAAAINHALISQNLRTGEEFTARNTIIHGPQEELTATKLNIIIGLIKRFLNRLGFYFGGTVYDTPADPSQQPIGRYDPNLNSQTLPNQALPEMQRAIDLATQKLQSEVVENDAGNVYTNIINYLLKSRRIPENDTVTFQLVIDIIIKFYSGLKGNKYSTGRADNAFNIIMEIYDALSQEINDMAPRPPSSSNEASPPPDAGAVRTLWNNFSTFISGNGAFIREIAALVLIPDANKVRQAIEKVLDEFRLSQSGQIVPPSSSLSRDTPATGTPATPAIPETQAIPATGTPATPATQQPVSTLGSATFINNLVDTQITAQTIQPQADKIELDRLIIEYEREIARQQYGLTQEATAHARALIRRIRELQNKLIDQSVTDTSQRQRQRESNVEEKKENTSGLTPQQLKIVEDDMNKTIRQDDLEDDDDGEGDDLINDAVDRALTQSAKADADLNDAKLDDQLDEDDFDESMSLLGRVPRSQLPRRSRMSGIRARLPNMPNASDIRARLPNMPNISRPRITLPRIPRPSMPAGWANNFRLTRQYLYVTNNNVIRMFNDHNSALNYARQDAGENVDTIRIVTRYGLYYRTGTPAPKSRSRPRSNIPQLPPGMGGGDGGDPGDDPNNDPDAFEDPDLRNAYNNNERFRGLSAKAWARLLGAIFVIGTGAVTIDQLIKSNQDINKDGTTSPPSGGDSGDTSNVPKVPTKPPSTGGGGGGGGKPDDNFFPDQYSKLNHSELWDSIGLGSVIDTYNGYVDEYNKARKDKSLTNTDVKILNKKINNFYGKFAEATNTPTLPELVKARSIYDNLRKEYDTASEKGLSFSSIIMIYKNLRDAANHVDQLTSKYLDIENGLFGTAKSKDDADVTIDDHDDAFANITTKANTSMGGKAKALVDPGSKILSKGMIERIARKLNNQANADQGVNEELQRFDAFSMVKDYDYPTGLGTIEDNPLMRRNKEYEIKQYLTANPNPRPYNVPSRERLERVSKTDGTEYFMAIQNTNGVHENPNYVPMGKEVKFSNPNDTCGSKFEKSKLFNPPVAPKKKNVPTGSNMIRSGPYQGVNVDQYYQYGSVEYKHNEKFNKYPLTDMQPDQKPKQHYKIAAKLIKKSRVPDTYSLK